MGLLVRAVIVRLLAGIGLEHVIAIGHGMRMAAVVGGKLAAGEGETECVGDVGRYQ